MTLETVNLVRATALIETGLSFKPSIDSKLNLDIGVRNFTGQCQGISGTADFKYKF